MRVSPIIGRTSSPKTYPDFVAHISTLASSGVIAWGAAVSMEGAPKAYRTTAASPAGNMAGSSWLTNFRSAGANLAAPARIVQHGLPSEGEFNAQVLAGRQIFFAVENGTVGSSFPSVTRNGFTSTEVLASTGRVRCRRLIWWAEDQAWECDPYAGTAPQPYNW